MNHKKVGSTAISCEWKSARGRQYRELSILRGTAMGRTNFQKVILVCGLVIYAGISQAQADGIILTPEQDPTGKGREDQKYLLRSYGSSVPGFGAKPAMDVLDGYESMKDRNPWEGAKEKVRSIKDAAVEKINHAMGRDNPWGSDVPSEKSSYRSSSGRRQQETSWTAEPDRVYPSNPTGEQAKHNLATYMHSNASAGVKVVCDAKPSEGERNTCYEAALKRTTASAASQSGKVPANDKEIAEACSPLRGTDADACWRYYQQQGSAPITPDWDTNSNSPGGNGAPDPMSNPWGRNSSDGPYGSNNTPPLEQELRKSLRELEEKVASTSRAYDQAQQATQQLIKEVQLARNQEYEQELAEESSGGGGGDLLGKAMMNAATGIMGRGGRSGGRSAGSGSANLPVPKSLCLSKSGGCYK